MERGRDRGGGGEQGRKGGMRGEGAEVGKTGEERNRRE